LKTASAATSGIAGRSFSGLGRAHLFR
jgi:hypothetical protein